MVENAFIENVKISLTNPEDVLAFTRNYNYLQSGYICFFGLYPLTQSIKNKELQYVLNKSLLNPLHGKMIEFYLKRKGYKNIKTTDAVFLLKKLLKEPVSHFFYGANNETLQKIKEKIAVDYPEAKVCGYKEPPFIDLDNIANNEKVRDDFVEINKLQPQIVWVGLGGVKQDFVMHHYMPYLDHSLLIGVGAVFDYFAGNLKLSSERTKSMGFRWLQRLFQQPKLLKKQIDMIGILITVLFRKLFRK